MNFPIPVAELLDQLNAVLVHTILNGDDARINDALENVDDFLWDYDSDCFFRYPILPDLSTNEVKRLNLLLQKLKQNFRLDWNINEDGDENDYENFDRVAFSQFIANLSASAVKKVDFNVEAPTSCNTTLMEGIQRFVQENNSCTILELSGYLGPPPNILVRVQNGLLYEENADFDPKYLSIFRQVISAFEQHSNTLEKLTVMGFDLRTTCKEFSNLLTRGPKTVYFCGGRIDLQQGACQALVPQNGVRELTLGCVHFPPESLTRLPRLLGSLKHLELLNIEFEEYPCENYPYEELTAESNQQAVLSLFQQCKVPKLVLTFTLKNDYNLEETFLAMRDNTSLIDLSLDLQLEDCTHPHIPTTHRKEVVSPHGWDWLFYTQCRLLTKVLEESNTTLERINFQLSGIYSWSHLYQEQMESVRYWTSLNHFGRGKIRSGECNIGSLLCIAQEEILKDHHQTYGFDFVPIAYGLLRECPTLWATH